MPSRFPPRARSTRAPRNPPSPLDPPRPRSLDPAEPRRGDRAAGPLPRLLLGLLLVATPLSASAQLAIDEIVITSGPSYKDGAFVSYVLDPFLIGDGIQSVRLVSESGTLDQLLFEVTPDEFVCIEEIPSAPCEQFASLADISALGDLTFEITGELGELDSVTIALADYDPGAGQNGFPDILSPANLETGLPTSATLEWTTPPGWVQVVEATLEELLTGNFTDENVFEGAPVTATTWSPNGLANGTLYRFDLAFFEFIEEDNGRTTDQDRPFDYLSAFEASNRIAFGVPEPSFGASLAFAVAALVGLARRDRCPRRTPRPRAASRRRVA